jgi:hypothetical protein
MNRPTGVTIIAVLSFLGAFVLAVIAFGFLAGGALIASMGMTLPVSLVGIGVVVAACFFFALGILYVFNGIGLLKLQNWARILTIVLVGLGLLSAALGILSGLFHFRTLLMLREICVAAIDLWILSYLFKPHVKQAFGTTGF